MSVRRPGVFCRSPIPARESRCLVCEPPSERVGDVFDQRVSGHAGRVVSSFEADNRHDSASRDPVGQVYLEFPGDDGFGGQKYMFVIHAYNQSGGVTSGVYSRLYASMR